MRRIEWPAPDQDQASRPLPQRIGGSGLDLLTLYKEIVDLRARVSTIEKSISEDHTEDREIRSLTRDSRERIAALEILEERSHSPAEKDAAAHQMDWGEAVKEITTLLRHITWAGLMILLLTGNINPAQLKEALATLKGALGSLK